MVLIVKNASARVEDDVTFLEIDAGDGDILDAVVTGEGEMLVADSPEVSEKKKPAVKRKRGRPRKNPDAGS